MLTPGKKSSISTEGILTVWGVIVILWSIFRANMQPPLWFSELVAKPLIFLLPVYLFAKKNNIKQSFWSFVGFPEKQPSKEFIFSLVLLVLVFSMGILMFFVSSGARLIAPATVNFSQIASILFLALASSVSEEIVGRGFMFNHLYRHSKNFIVALFISSLLFFILYIPGALTAKIGGPALLMNLLLNFLLSFMTAVLFYLRRNILPAIAFHTAILLWFDLLLTPAM